MTSLETCFTKTGDLVAREVAGEMVIVPVRSHVADLESIYVLNDVASTVWGLIDGRTSVARLVDSICSAHQVTPEKASRDLLEFLGALEAAGLVRSSGVGD